MANIVWSLEKRFIFQEIYKNVEVPPDDFFTKNSEELFSENSLFSCYCIKLIMEENKLVEAELSETKLAEIESQIAESKLRIAKWTGFIFIWFSWQQSEWWKEGKIIEILTSEMTGSIQIKAAGNNLNYVWHVVCSCLLSLEFTNYFFNVEGFNDKLFRCFGVLRLFFDKFTAQMETNNIADPQHINYSSKKELI